MHFNAYASLTMFLCLLCAMGVVDSFKAARQHEWLPFRIFLFALAAALTACIVGLLVP